MSATYREPYQFSAGVLALLVHGIFFSVLYFGFSWQTHPLESMSVELWDGLPSGIADLAPAPPAPPILPPAPEPIIAPPVVESVKPDIVLPEKSKPASRPTLKPHPSHPIPSHQPTLLERYGISGNSGGGSGTARSAGGRVQQLVQQTGKLSDSQRTLMEYVAKIRAKIKGNVVAPPDVPLNALVRFAVTLLPDGSVINTRLTQGSDYAAYDTAVERAILKSQPLPLPPQPELFNQFRELNLCFSPFKEELCR